MKMEKSPITFTDANGFKNLTEVLFKEVYGVASKELESNIELRDEIREAIRELRQSYRSSQPTTPYEQDNIRKAYMIAYYPYYIEPAFYLLIDDIFFRVFMNSDDIKIIYFAGGSCPELIGSVGALKLHFPNKAMSCIICDKEDGWLPYQSITMRICNQLFDKFSVAHKTFDIIDSTNKLNNLANSLKKTDIFFLQNYLSHVSPDKTSINEFFRWLIEVMKLAKSGAFFIMLDFGYSSVNQILNRIVSDSSILETLNSKIVNQRTKYSDGKPICFEHPRSSEGIYQNIFEGFIEIPKKYSKFYYVVLRKN